ncbi:histone H4-like TAF Taf6 [Glugoides intestinalis]
MLFSKETLKAFAQSKGISNIEDDALRVLAQDLEYRIKELCQEASKFMLASHRTKLNIGDVNNALICRNVEPLFGYDSNDTLIFRGLPSGIYYVPDEEIDLEEYLERQLPKIPLRPYVQSHWLAIEGVQPPIQQNPLLIEKPEIKHDSLSIYQEELELKQQNKHLLTKELSLYFEKILQTIETAPETAISCLLNETGIQQLVPYFLHHFKIEIRKDVTNERSTIVILEMYGSLLKNKYIFVDPYLHEIIPPILSCAVGKNVSDAVKSEASRLIKFIFEEFGVKYKSLSPRIVNFLIKAWLDDTKPETVQYGALHCLRQLSERVIEDYITPNIIKYSSNHKSVNELLEEIVKAHGKQ